MASAVDDEGSVAGQGGLLGRLHAWIAVPSMPLAEGPADTFAVVNYAVVVGLVAYVSYIPLFLLVGAPWIAWVNAGVSVGFCVALFLARRAFSFAALSLCAALIVTHSSLTTLWFGWDGGFHLPIILALELGMVFTYVPLGRRLALAVLLGGAYLALLVAARSIEPRGHVAPAVTLGFGYSNAAIFLFVTIGVLAYYSWNVISSRAAKEQAIEELRQRNELLRMREAELAVARDAAEDANRAKSMFLANMSHELRTPLNAILGYTDLIAEEAEDAGTDLFADEIARVQGAGRHLLALIDDILDLSKVEAGHMEVEVLDVDLAEVAGSLEDTAVALAKRNDNRFSISTGDAPPRFRTDPTKLRQILVNLVSNACKFTEKGEIAVELRAARVNDGDGLEVAVRDTGIGMSQEVLGTIFDRFAQADGSTTRRYGGTGLGLAISWRFCEMLGGSIDVESEEGAGSTFTVRLPALD